MCDLGCWHDQRVEAIIIEDLVQSLGTADSLVCGAEHKSVPPEAKRPGRTGLDGIVVKLRFCPGGLQCGDELLKSILGGDSFGVTSETHDFLTALSGRKGDVLSDMENGQS